MKFTIKSINFQTSKQFVIYFPAFKTIYKRVAYDLRFPLFKQKASRRYFGKNSELKNEN